MRVSLALGIAVCATLTLSALSANAASLNLYNTGVDSSGNVLAAGSTDSHWALSGTSVSSGPSDVLGSSSGNWFSSWAADGTVGSPGYRRPLREWD